ncbi:MAG: M48 family metalloprotease [Planctomycetota bacterium]
MKSFYRKVAIILLVLITSPSIIGADELDKIKQDIANYKQQIRIYQNKIIESRNLLTEIKSAPYSAENEEAIRLTENAIAKHKSAVQKIEEMLALLEKKKDSLIASPDSPIDASFRAALSHLRKIFPTVVAERDLALWWDAFRNGASKAMLAHYEKLGFKPYDDAEHQKIVDEALLRFLKVSNYKEIGSKVILIDAGEKWHFLGAAHPSGAIAFEKSFIEYSKDHPEQLDFVTGHERVHVDHQHSVQAIADVGYVPTNITNNPEVAVLSEKATKGMFSRQRESEADEQSVEYMLKQGRSPEEIKKGVNGLFAELSRREKEVAERRDSKIESTAGSPEQAEFRKKKYSHWLELTRGHPTAEERLENLKQKYPFLR